MEAVDLIRDALMSGSVAATTKVASKALLDTYQGLKVLVQRKFDGEPKAELALDEHESDPETWERPLKAELVRVGAAKDPEIVEAAQRLLRLINPQQAALGKYNVQVGGDIQGLVQGDNAQVTMQFGEKSSVAPEKR